MFPLECFVSCCILLFCGRILFPAAFLFRLSPPVSFFTPPAVSGPLRILFPFYLLISLFSGGRYPPVIHPVSMSIHATPCSRVKKYIPDNRNGYSAGNTAKTISSSASTRLVNSVGSSIVFFPSARNNIPTDKNKAVPGAALQWHKLPEAASVPLPVHKKDCFLPYQP